MKYKLICSDIDGTLVDTRGRVTKENQAAIHELEKAGIMFAICSGRMYSAVNMISLFYEIPSYVICSNGAVIGDTRTNQVLHQFPLSKDNIEKICAVGEKYHCVIGFNTVEGVLYRGSDGIEDVLYHEANMMYSSVTGKKIQLVRADAYGKYITENDIMKISLWASSDEDYEKVCNQINQISGVTAASAMKWNLEMTEAGVTKWHGVKWLLNRFGLKREEVICIGDTMNDYEMVRNAGLGVAMKNGDTRLKEVASYITDTNDDSGVAKLIKKCLEGKL